MQKVVPDPLQKMQTRLKVAPMRLENWAGMAAAQPESSCGTQTLETEQGARWSETELWRGIDEISADPHKLERHDQAERRERLPRCPKGQ